MQKPILAGLPCKTRKTAIMPNNTPAVMIGYFSFKTSTSFLKIFKRNLKEIPKRTAMQFSCFTDVNYNAKLNPERNRNYLYLLSGE
jgi:methylmalonyl-CoA mutase N-terminal domain/subunit